MGVSQPAWITLDSPEDSQGAYQCMALAYMVEESAEKIIDEEDITIFLPPMLAHNFWNSSTLLIRPWRRHDP